MKGWVYVMSNPAMTGLVKVGYSMSDPELRAQELGHTGIPNAYVVEYEALVPNPYRIEQAVHAKLSAHHAGKEWFSCPPEEAVAVIRLVAGNSILRDEFKKANRRKSLDLQEKKQSERAAQQARVDAEQLEIHRANDAKLAKAKKDREGAIEAVLTEAEKNDRVCPNLRSWTALYRMLPGKSPSNVAEVLDAVAHAFPLLSGKRYDVLSLDTTKYVPGQPVVWPPSHKALAKYAWNLNERRSIAKARLREHIEWALDHGCLDKVANFLRSLPEREWEHYLERD